MNTYVKCAAAALGVSAAIFASIGPATAQATYPDKCKSEMPMENMPMSNMPMGGQMPMGGSGAGPMGNLNDHQNASMEGMMSMHQNMMQGMMKEDADVAFACGMIAHHMGGISMAEVELEHGNNDEMKAAAQKVIDDQTKEIEELTAWIEKEVK